MNQYLTIQERPRLRQPYLVAGFSGWLDGGEASTGTVKYLIRRLRAKKFAEIATTDFQVFQVPGIEPLRPHIKFEEGVIKEVRFTSNEFFYWKNEKAEGKRDLILLLGTEPNLRWLEYLDGVLDLAQQFGVKKVYSVGGVMGGVPHTREPAISCGVSDPHLKEELDKYAVRYSNYEGPSTFNSILLTACQKRGVEAVHMTGRAVYYPDFNIVIPYNPQVIHSILKRLVRMLGISLDLSDLERAGRELVDKLNFMAEQSSQLREYVEELERNYVEQRYEEPIQGAPEDFVRDAEEFLRQRREGE
ncbi:MAG: PAC2 family protein [Dehalococcoidia bacterium]